MNLLSLRIGTIFEAWPHCSVSYATVIVKVLINCIIFVCWFLLQCAYSSPIRLDDEPGLIGSLCYQLGVIQPYGSKPVNLCDRYHLGGPLALRGFSVAGAGPRASVSQGIIYILFASNLQCLSFSCTKICISASDVSDSLGSLRRAQVLGMLSVPLPRTIQSLPPVRALLFLNAGSVDDGTASLGATTMRLLINFYTCIIFENVYL